MTYQNSGLFYLNGDIRGSAIRDVYKPAAIEKNGYIYFVWEQWQGNIWQCNDNSGTIVTDSMNLNNLTMYNSSNFSSDNQSWSLSRRLTKPARLIKPTRTYQ